MSYWFNLRKKIISNWTKIRTIKKIIKKWYRKNKKSKIKYSLNIIERIIKNKLRALLKKYIKIFKMVSPYSNLIGDKALWNYEQDKIQNLLEQDKIQNLLTELIIQRLVVSKDQCILQDELIIQRLIQRLVGSRVNKLLGIRGETILKELLLKVIENKECKIIFSDKVEWNEIVGKVIKAIKREESIIIFYDAELIFKRKLEINQRIVKAIKNKKCIIILYDFILRGDKIRGEDRSLNLDVFSKKGLKDMLIKALAKKEFNIIFYCKYEFIFKKDEECQEYNENNYCFISLVETPLLYGSFEGLHELGIAEFKYYRERYYREISEESLKSWLVKEMVEETRLVKEIINNYIIVKDIKEMVKKSRLVEEIIEESINFWSMYFWLIKDLRDESEESKEYIQSILVKKLVEKFQKVKGGAQEEVETNMKLIIGNELVVEFEKLVEDLELIESMNKFQKEVQKEVKEYMEAVFVKLKEEHMKLYQDSMLAQWKKEDDKLWKL